jgi:flagellar biosynthesis protein FliQ
MDVEFMRIVSDMLTTTTRLSAPILIASLVIGVLVGLVQTVTGNWMLGELEDFMIRSLDSIPALLAG